MYMCVFVWSVGVCVCSHVFAPADRDVKGWVFASWKMRYSPMDWSTFKGIHMAGNIQLGGCHAGFWFRVRVSELGLAS